MIFLELYSRLRACLHEGGGPQVGEVTCSGLPLLTCKRDHIKMRDCMDKRVTPPTRVTSPTWGPPPSCKQALIPQTKISWIRESGFRRWEMRREIYPLDSAILLLNYTTYPSLYTPALNKAIKLSDFYQQTTPYGTEVPPIYLPYI